MQLLDAKNPRIESGLGGLGGIGVSGGHQISRVWLWGVFVERSKPQLMGLAYGGVWLAELAVCGRPATCEAHACGAGDRFDIWKHG